MPKRRRRNGIPEETTFLEIRRAILALNPSKFVSSYYLSDKIRESEDFKSLHRYSIDVLPQRIGKFCVKQGFQRFNGKNSSTYIIPDEWRESDQIIAVW